MLDAAYFAQLAKQREEELALIHSVQEGLSSKLEMQGIYDLVGDKIRDTFDAQVVMISQYDPITNRVYHHYAIERGRHLQLTTWRAIDVSRMEIVRTRKPLMLCQERIMQLLESAKMAVIPGTEVPLSWLGVPMLVGDEVRGIVSMQHLDRENAYTDSDVELLATLTNSMSQSLENARLFNETQRLLHLLEQEMEMARQTQRSILPLRAPRHPGYDIGSLIISARAVSGDFYDFIHLGPHKLCIVLGDVSDKGLPAALFMALTFSLLRAETGLAEDPLQVLRNVNRYLLKMNTSCMFVTLLYCLLDFETGRLQFLRAGHYYPIILNKDGSFIGMPFRGGQPLGLFQDVMIDRQEYIIPEGGLALLYSDGLTEAIDPEGNEFGLERVKEQLMAHRQESAKTICKNLWRAVENHNDQVSHQDDFTTVVIKRN
jgi:serine phosphatase RsbU (regulator of sigma subunit)